MTYSTRRGHMPKYMQLSRKSSKQGRQQEADLLARSSLSSGAGGTACRAARCRGRRGSRPSSWAWCPPASATLGPWGGDGPSGALVPDRKSSRADAPTQRWHLAGRRGGGVGCVVQLGGGCFGGPSVSARGEGRLWGYDLRFGEPGKMSENM